MKIYSVIPARGGSKGVAKKNIKLLVGYPLIAYSIAASKLSSKIERTIVSTDSQEIADIALSYGAEVPFLRPKEFARDDSTDIEFVKHMLDWLEQNEGNIPEYLIHLRPTTPLRDPAVIDNAIDKMIKSREATSVRSIHFMEESPYKLFKIKNKFLEGFFPDEPRPEYYNLPRQSFPDTYSTNGYVDVIKTATVINSDGLHGDKILSFITDKAGDIDSIEDFEYIAFQLQKKGNAIYDFLKCDEEEKRTTEIDEFSPKPQVVDLVNTKYRRIKTKIPHPEYAPVFEALKQYEAKSMHGQLPVVWGKASDFQVFDKRGNCWIDFTSTIFVANTGHSNPNVIKAIKAQLDKKLLHTYTFATDIRAEFLKKLIETTPEFCEKAFLLSAGTEATECAVKLMRMYGHNIDITKTGIISFKGSVHGRTMGAEMLKGDPISGKWLGFKDPNMYHLDFPYPWDTGNDKSKKYNWRKRFKDDMARLAKEKRIGFDSICGFMIESYQGWGAIMYSREYIQELVSFARKHNILVTFDEVQGGFGRTGKMFVYEHYNVEPDLLCLGKGIGGGMPLSAVIGRREILDTPLVGSMSSTYSANPLCCAAGLANIGEMRSRNLVEESARKGKILHKRLKDMKNKYPDYVNCIMGTGLLAAILVKDPTNKKQDALLADRICERAMQKGLLLVHTGRESVKIGPPLTIPDNALNEGIDVLDESIGEIVKTW